MTTKTQETWHAANAAGDHQGLVISDVDGRNVAVTYDVKDAPLVAAAPAMLKALRGVIHHNDATKPLYQLPKSLIRQIEDAIQDLQETV